MSLSTHIPPIYPAKLNGAAIKHPEGWNKVSSYVSHEDWATINAAASQSGAISYIIDHAIKHTADTIRRVGFIPVADTTRFLDWLRERTFSEPAQVAKGPASDVPRRASRARKSTANAADVAAGTRTDAEK